MTTGAQGPVGEPRPSERSRDEKVAVVMTCFNEGPWIRQSVASILDQTAAGSIAEIVIIDDGSDEETLRVLEEVRGWDERISVMFERARGVATNRNTGVRHTGAAFVAFLDADDWWHRDKLAEQIALMREHPSAGLAYTNFTLFGAEGPEAGTVARIVDHTAKQDTTLEYFLHDAPIVPSTILMRRAAFEAVGGFDETIRVFEDTDFFLRLSKVTRFAALRRPLTFKRNHPGSMTSRRTDLMTHHAAVAFRFAAGEPRLLRFVGRRLAERARKLGNLEASDGHTASACQLYRLSLWLWPFSPVTWVAFGAAVLGGDGLVRRLRAAVAAKA